MIKQGEIKMETGIKGKLSIKVTNENTAAALGSGTLNVFSTPAMIALMEKTAWESVAPYLAEGESTVGISLDVKHLAATPVGDTVTCESELVEVDRRRLVFSLKVTDSVDVIGEGKHERFVVTNEKFMAKAASKLAK